jgi:MerR family transcriptional regulator, thiopeptide resistance regulator
MNNHDSPDPGRRIGALAEASGLSVRALRHYDEIGLLAPSGRSDAGHRLYSASDVERLYRIRLLRSLDIALPDIGRALDDPSSDLRSTMAAHLDDVDRRIDASNRLRARLATLLQSFDSTNHPEPDNLLEVLEAMSILDHNVQRGVSILVYDDLEAAFNYLCRVFELGPGEVHRDGEGHVVHVQMQAGHGEVWLHRESPTFRLASPKSLGGASAMVAVIVDDVDAHFRHAVGQGAIVVYEPVDQPYGREWSARDPEGALWSFLKPIG